MSDHRFLPYRTLPGARARQLPESTLMPDSCVNTKAADQSVIPHSGSLAFLSLGPKGPCRWGNDISRVHFLLSTLRPCLASPQRQQRRRPQCLPLPAQEMETYSAGSAWPAVTRLPSGREGVQVWFFSGPFILPVMVRYSQVLNASIINNLELFPQEYLCSYSVKFQIQVSSIKTWL